AGRIKEPVIIGIADARPRRQVPVDAGRCIDREGDRKAEDSRRENRRAVDAGPVEIRLDANHDMGNLQLRARCSANRSAAETDGVVIETVGEDVKGVLLAPRPATIDPKIDAGPIVGEDRRRSNEGLGGHGRPGAYRCQRYSNDANASDASILREATIDYAARGSPSVVRTQRKLTFGLGNYCFNFSQLCV